MDHEQIIQKMQAQWKRGTAHFASFFTLLGEVKNEIGSSELKTWCLDELGIKLTRVSSMIGVLRKDAYRDEQSPARRELRRVCAARGGAIDHQQAQRMKAHWSKGIDDFKSFLLFLTEVKHRIGDEDDFKTWCFDKLRIGYSVISKVIGVLKKDQELAARQASRRRG